jgi:hypothetical protein
MLMVHHSMICIIIWLNKNFSITFLNNSWFSKFCPQFLTLKYNLRYLNLLFYFFMYLFYYYFFLIQILGLSGSIFIQDLCLRQRYYYAISMARPSSLISCFGRKRVFFLYEAWKERKVFFCLRLKNGTYEGFTLHKEIYYITKSI